MEVLQQRFTTITGTSRPVAQARALQPIAQRKLFDRQVMLFDGVQAEAIEELGVSTHQP